MRFALALILIGIFFNCNGQNDFSWLEGRWQNQKSGAIEEWGMADEGLEGKVYKLNSTDTIIQEKLNILKIDVSHLETTKIYKQNLPYKTLHYGDITP